MLPFNISKSALNYILLPEDEACYVMCYILKYIIVLKLLRMFSF